MTKEELEKDAEEYANGKGHEHYNYLFEENAGSPVDFARWCFKDGAEFGYNKALKETWHYLLKGEFPTENTMLLLARKTVNGIQALIGYYRKEQFEVFNEKSCKMNNIDNVYAWKEIALPEFPKENE
jgi:hypothetical protein